MKLQSLFGKLQMWQKAGSFYRTGKEQEKKKENM